MANNETSLLPLAPHRKKKQKDATMRTLERKRQLEEFHRGWPFFISVSLVVTTCPAVARNNHIQQYRAIFLPARLAPKLIGTNVRVTLLIPYIPQTRGKHEDYWSPLKNGSTVAGINGEISSSRLVLSSGTLTFGRVDFSAL